jgi:hypothetical protein
LLGAHATIVDHQAGWRERLAVVSVVVDLAAVVVVVVVAFAGIFTAVVVVFFTAVIVVAAVVIVELAAVLVVVGARLVFVVTLGVLSSLVPSAGPCPWLPATARRCPAVGVEG